MTPNPPEGAPDIHEEVQMMLPWYMTGRLEPDEQALVAAHLAGCGECAREAAAAQALAGMFTHAAPDVDAGWARIMPRLDPAPRSALVLPFARRLRAAAGPMLVAAGVAVGVVVVPWMLPGGGTAPVSYEGLGSTAAPGNALLMAAPGTSEADLRAAVRGAGASVVGGPTAAGAWVLNVPRADFEARLAALRADERVALAHPLTQAPAP